MKNILRIARIELSQLFYSPVAWIVLLVFIFQSGWQYVSLLERMEMAQQMGQISNNLTNVFFSGFSGLFPKMQEYLYLYIPLLTMGLISRETHSGSIKLLYSSPIRVFDIVIGKYLAMIAYCLVLITVLLTIGVISLFTIDHASFSYIFSGIIGLYLLICAYSAIGLFMSSLTSYQVVAAISTLVVLAALKFIGGLWQDINFVRDITYFLSISGRAEESINGLLGSNDMLYFVIVIILFLGLTLLKLEFERRTISLLQKIVRYVGFIALMLLIGYVSSIPQLMFFKDMTLNESRTLTAESKSIIKKKKGPVTITTYINMLDENYFFGLPQFQNNDRKNFDMYFRYMPQMRMEYVFYYAPSTNVRLYQENPGLNDKQLAEKMAKIHNMNFDVILNPKQVNKLIDLKAEQNRSVRTISYNGKQTYLRVYDDLFKQPAEKEISAALKRLVTNTPRVGFVTGHQERNINRSGDRDFKVSTMEISFRYALVNQGFEVKEVSLVTDKLKDQIDILVIADPTTPFSTTEIANLNDYVAQGGNLLIAAEPGSQRISNPILNMVGVNMVDSVLVQKSENFDPSFVFSRVKSKNWSKLVKNSIFFDRDSAFVTTPSAAPLEPIPSKGFIKIPILATQSSNTWPIPTPLLSQTKVLIDQRTGHGRDSYTIGYAINRKVSKAEQHIFVIGDADFMSNAELSRQNIRSLNFSFVTEIFRWFSNGEFPIDTTRAQPIDNKILINTVQLTWIRWSLLAILPAIIALSVAWMLISRKRR
jgi:ABC-2 type transport system permease protein